MNINGHAVILAAGEGTRMKSKKPKVLCEVLFKPMVQWVIDSCKEAGISDLCAVVGHGAEMVQSALGDQVEYAYQLQRLGTGHAVMQAKDFLQSAKGEHTLILCGDAPFVDAETIRASLEAHTAADNSVTVITANLPDPTGYGRIKKENGAFVRIVEHKEASDEEKLICEVNSGAYWFKRDDLLTALEGLDSNNSQNEYYLTDTIYILKNAGKNVGTFVAKGSDVVLGANDRKTLYELNQIANKRVIDRLMSEGVEFVSLDGIVLSPDCSVGTDTVILPGTIIKGKVEIGSGCVIGPNSMLQNCTIGDNTLADNAKITDAVIGSGAQLGPFMQVRPGSVIGDNTRIGNFTEIKNSNIGNGTKVSHLTYVGDSDVGERVNFGCGTVTVNYDGVNKNRTTIGDDCFIGCNTNLIAPVTVGSGAYTAAGTTITNDVPAGALSIGRSRQTDLPGWADKKMASKRKK